MPNIPETVAASLACASIGAIWSAAAPEFGVQSVVDRFAQIDPQHAERQANDGSGRTSTTPLPAPDACSDQVWMTIAIGLPPAESRTTALATPRSRWRVPPARWDCHACDRARRPRTRRTTNAGLRWPGSLCPARRHQQDPALSVHTREITATASQGTGRQLALQVPKPAVFGHAPRPPPRAICSRLDQGNRTI